MKVRLIHDVDDGSGTVLKKGQVNERPDSYWWLDLGIAEPIDDEAKAHQAKIDARNERLRNRVKSQVEEMQAQLREQREAAEREKLADFEQLLREGT